MKNHVTMCGIPGVGLVPHDFHMCHFYPSGVALMDALVPYFVAGLRCNERCIWVVSPPHSAAEIRAELASRSTLHHAESMGTLTLYDSLDWYGPPMALDPDAIIQRWIEEEERALIMGFSGLRIAGNAHIGNRENWTRFMDYEKKFHARILGRRIVAFCNYSRKDCQPIDILEVTRHHHAALDRVDQHWQVYLHSQESERTPHSFV